MYRILRLKNEKYIRVVYEKYDRENDESNGRKQHPQRVVYYEAANAFVVISALEDIPDQFVLEKLVGNFINFIR